MDFHHESSLISSSGAVCSGAAEDFGKAMANVYPMKMAKKQSKSRPSTLFSIFSVALSRNMSLAHISNTTEERIQSGISFRKVFRVMTIGANSAVHPTIISVLNMLLPTTLPMAMSALPFRAEATLPVSSGADVPKATMVSPITMEGMRKRLATEAAPSVSPLAPSKMRINPPISNSIFIICIIFGIVILCRIFGAKICFSSYSLNRRD